MEMTAIQPISSLSLVVLDLLNISYTLFCPTGTPTPPPPVAVVLYLSNPFPRALDEEDMTVEEGENLASANFFPALILSMTLPNQDNPISKIPIQEKGERTRTIQH
jgi:hypothetical protein